MIVTMGCRLPAPCLPQLLCSYSLQVKRTKEILSANTEAPLSVEELLGGHDFRSSISRTEFERLAGKPAAAFWVLCGCYSAKQFYLPSHSLRQHCRRLL